MGSKQSTGDTQIHRTIRLDVCVQLRYDIFQILSGCPKQNFGPISRGQPHSPDVNRCIFNNFNSMVTRNLIKRLGAYAQPSAQWDLNWEPSNSNCNFNPLRHFDLGMQELMISIWLKGRFQDLNTTAILSHALFWVSGTISENDVSR